MTLQNTPLTLKKLALLDHDSYYELAHFYVSESQPELASAAYEKGIALGRDSVLNANESGWLVNYYFEHKQKDKAMALAKNAAEVYSNRGLMTMARLLESMGDFKAVLPDKKFGCKLGDLNIPK